MEPDAAKHILRGTADALNSAFHLGYNMLLNLSRVEDADPERMMALSFHQFQAEAAVPALSDELTAVTSEAESISIADEPEVAEYYQLCTAMAEVRVRATDDVSAASQPSWRSHAHTHNNHLTPRRFGNRCVPWLRGRSTRCHSYRCALALCA